MTLTTLPAKPSRASRSHRSRATRPLIHSERLTPDGALGAHTAPVARELGAAAAHAPLARYTDPVGRLREVLASPGRDGSVLVIDRDATTHGDRRLVAHLAPDEPPENASLVCRHYLLDHRGRRCRVLTTEDLLVVPLFEECAEGPKHVPAPLEGQELIDRHGCAHRLEALDVGMTIPELRWCRRMSEVPGASKERAAATGHTVRSPGSQPVVGGGVGTRSEGRGSNWARWAVCLSGRPESVRDVVGCLESYEPVRTLTARALARHRDDSQISVSVLRAELRRIDASRIVLNRGLRRAVLNAMCTQGLSLSEIAFRCGRVKRDGKGNTSGETSWLSRRVGISPESGGGEPTPWIHSEVLALIARSGLGVSPREVEL